jgi:thymidine phosphorylase
LNHPLASAAGIAVEVANAVEFLTGRHRDPRLEEVTLALATEMLVAAGRADSHRDAELRARDALDTGQAAEIFGRMVSLLGGPVDFVEKYQDHLPKAPVRIEVTATESGFVSEVETRGIGVAVVELGGGRTDPGQKIDHAVGITGLAAVGTEIGAGETLAVIHARSSDEAEAAAAAVRAAYSIGETRPRRGDTIIRRVSATTAP